MSSYHLCFPTVFVAGYVWIFQIMMSEFCVHDSTHYVRVSKVKVIKNMLCFLTQVPSTPSFSDNILRPKDFGLLRWCIPLLSWIHDLKLHSEPFFCYEVAGHKRSWFDQQIVWIPFGRWTLLAMERDQGNGELHRLQSTGMLKYGKYNMSGFNMYLRRHMHPRKTQTNQVFKTRLI